MNIAVFQAYDQQKTEKLFSLQILTTGKSIRLAFFFFFPLIAAVFYALMKLIPE